MIITLKGADFSASNIGQLTAWRIRTDLGDGATYDGPTSVEKGLPLSATVTVDEAYTLGEVSVTMAGVALTDAYTIEGNVVTISIAEVTGTVVIAVATAAVDAGGGDEGGEGGGEDTGVTDYTADPNNWVSQTISSSGVVSNSGITQSNIMAANKFEEGITITALTSERILVAQVTYNADGSFKARSSWTTLDLATATTSVTYSDENPFNVVIATATTNTSYSVSEMMDLVDVRSAE